MKSILTIFCASLMVSVLSNGASDNVVVGATENVKQKSPFCKCDPCLCDPCLCGLDERVEAKNVELTQCGPGGCAVRPVARPVRAVARPVARVGRAVVRPVVRVAKPVVRGTARVAVAPLRAVNTVRNNSLERRACRGNKVAAARLQVRARMGLYR